MTDVKEILRLLQLGQPDRRIARNLGVSRNTVARSRDWAAPHNLLETPLPAPAALAALLTPAKRARPPHEQSLVEPFRERVVALQQAGVEGQAIHQLLVEQHEFGGSYSSVKRPVRGSVRIEVEPGDEAQSTSALPARCSSRPRPRPPRLGLRHSSRPIRRAEEKIHDVVGLYLDPPTNAVVVSLDEKPQIQALSRTQPLLPLRPGLPARQTHDYRRNGLTSLYAALEVATGTRTTSARLTQRRAGPSSGRRIAGPASPGSDTGSVGPTGS